MDLKNTEVPTHFKHIQPMGPKHSFLIIIHVIEAILEWKCNGEAHQFHNVMSCTGSQV